MSSLWVAGKMYSHSFDEHELH